MRNYYAYLWTLANCGTPFYVGKGGAGRCLEHVKREDWPNQPCTVHVFPCESEESALQMEREIYTELRILGYQLKNKQSLYCGVYAKAVRHKPTANNWFNEYKGKIAWHKSPENEFPDILNPEVTVGGRRLRLSAALERLDSFQWASGSDISDLGRWHRHPVLLDDPEWGPSRHHQHLYIAASYRNLRKQAWRKMMHPALRIALHEGCRNSRNLLRQIEQAVEAVLKCDTDEDMRRLFVMGPKVPMYVDGAASLVSEEYVDRCHAYARSRYAELG